MEPTAALARLYGEPLLRVPEDLYIPPDALEVFLEAFEGPLDLLLYLIRKQNFNILDIPLVQLTQQYLAYVQQLRAHNLELAAEYLLMAAVLIEMKSRLLLPPVRGAGSDDAQEHQEPSDPRAELVRRLLEYEKIKLAAKGLVALPQSGRDFFPSHPQQIQLECDAQLLRYPVITPIDLQVAWQEMLRRASLVQKHRITRQELSVRHYMSLILKRLEAHKGFIEFRGLLHSQGSASIIVVTFVALLELAKERLIELTQSEAFAPLYLRLPYSSTSSSTSSHD